MRFAYIDSQGNEITIPSVDALELRIELGAIGPDTELFDAQADRWGPAHTHDIYHTLVRSAEAEGFVAPPPPVPRPAEEGKEQASAPGTPRPEPGTHGKEPFFDLAAEIMSDEGTWGGSEVVGTPAPSGPVEDLDLDLDFTLVDAPGEAPGPEGEGAASEADEAADAAGGSEPDAVPESSTETESILELAPDTGADASTPASADEPQPTGSDLADDLEVDVPFDAMDFSGVATPPAELELEQPLSSFDPEAPPAWLEHEGAWSDAEGDVMDFSRVRHSEEAEAPSQTPRADARQQERRVPRSRPSPPRRQRASGAPRAVLLVALVAAVGAGGWMLWQRFGGLVTAPEPAETGPQFPAVTIPDIPVELLPRFRAMGEAALTETIDGMRDQLGDFDIATEPRSDWLAGAYLANASSFPDVQAYWEGIGRYLERLREVDAQLFHESFQAQLAAGGVAADTAAMLTERADSGFLATRAGRAAAYGLMDDLVEASLALHAFLLENESEITHEPAAGGVSRDPVLEAVPSSRELGNRMWDMVDRITGALDALGTLDRVTTTRIVAVLFDRVRRAGFE